MLTQHGEFFIPRISWCRNKMQTWNGKMNTAWWCAESKGATWHNGAMTYVTWPEDEEAAIQFDHAVMLTWIWFSWLLKWWICYFCGFFVCDDICRIVTWSAKVSDVQKSVSCSLDDFCDSMRRISHLLKSIFAARYQKRIETEDVLFLDTVPFGNKILLLPINT